VAHRSSAISGGPRACRRHVCCKTVTPCSHESAAIRRAALFPLSSIVAPALVACGGSSSPAVPPPDGGTLAALTVRGASDAPPDEGAPDAMADEGVSYAMTDAAPCTVFPGVAPRMVIMNCSDGCATGRRPSGLRPCPPSPARAVTGAFLAQIRHGGPRPSRSGAGAGAAGSGRGRRDGAGAGLGPLERGPELSARAQCRAPRPWLMVDFVLKVAFEDQRAARGTSADERPRVGRGSSRKAGERPPAAPGREEDRDRVGSVVDLARRRRGLSARGVRSTDMGRARGPDRRPRPQPTWSRSEALAAWKALLVELGSIECCSGL